MRLIELFHFQTGNGENRIRKRNTMLRQAEAARMAA